MNIQFMKNKKTIILVVFVFIIILSYLVCNRVAMENHYMSQDDYLHVFDIHKSSDYDTVESLKKSQIIRETIDSSLWTVLELKGYKIQFDDDGLLANIKVTSSDFKCGRKKICVGSTLQEIKHAYRHQMKVKDTKPNEVGYIDGAEGNASNDSFKAWIFFEMDTDSKVKQITICPNGMF